MHHKLIPIPKDVSRDDDTFLIQKVELVIEIGLGNLQAEPHKLQPAKPRAFWQKVGVPCLHEADWGRIQPIYLEYYR